MTVRVGLIGGGLVAQAEHLPYLSSLRDRFSLAALAEPSRTVREALGDRYGIGSLEADGRPAPDCPRTVELLERTIHVDVSPLCEVQDLDEIAFAFEKVAKQVLA